MNPLLPISNFTIAGYPGILELPREREGDPQTGNRTIRRFSGQEKYLLLLIPSVIRAKGHWRISHTAGKPLASILEASFADLQDGADPNDPAQVQEQWYFDVDDLVLPITSTKQFNLIANTFVLAVTQRDLVRKYYNGTHDEANYPLGLTDATAIAIANAIRAGEDSVLLYRVVIRRTASISQNNTQVFMENIGNKFTKAQMISKYDIPNPVKSDMPEGEYLYRGSKKQQQTNGRFNVSSEWRHAPKWVDVFYPFATI